MNYELTGGTDKDTVISGSTPTIIGRLGGFDSTTVPNGTYTLRSVACYSSGVCGHQCAHHENAPVAYVTSDVSSGSSMSAVVTPIDTALNQAGTPITAGGDLNGTFPGHPIAITPNGATAYVANADGRVDVIPSNLATNTAGPDIPVGSRASCPAGIEPDDIAISSDGRTAYVASPVGCDTEMGLVIAIDTATNTIKFSLPISDASGDLVFVAPTAIAVTPNGSTAYVTSNENAPGMPGIVTPIDLTTQTAGAPINVCNDPTDIVVSPDGTTAYVTCQSASGGVDVLDTATNTVTATIALWAPSPRGATVGGWFGPAPATSRG